MSIDKEVFALWKEISPSSAFGAGIKECAGDVWIPSHANIKHALLRIKELEKKTNDTVVKKFLAALRRSILFEEPQYPPSEVMGVFYTHLIVEGVKDKHMLSLAEQSLNLLGVQQHLWNKKWPIEQQIFTIQECHGARLLLDAIKKQCKKDETRQAITALQKQLEKWKQNVTKITLKKHDFTEIYPLLKRRSKGLGRKNIYRQLLKEWYDHLEKPERIEELAVSWIDEELPAFKNIMKTLSNKYQCKNTVEDIEKALSKHQGAKPQELVALVKQLRRVLKPLAHNEWVQITSKYDVRVTETPPYLVPFLPTAAMQMFNNLTKKPFCISFVTTDPAASPSMAVPDVAQTIIHEEYGHCVNFLNSYTGVLGKPRLVEILGSSLDVPITEGISFYRELESVNTFTRILEEGPSNKEERALVRAIEKHAPFEDFVHAITFVVCQWRMVRFLRAVSDVRLNLEKQTFPQFIEWAHKKTGLSKKLIYDQTIHFQEHPGYAPCYSLVGQKLRTLQKKAAKKGISERAFNTFVCSIGFPARRVFERRIREKFNL